MVGQTVGAQQSRPSSDQTMLVPPSVGVEVLLAEPERPSEPCSITWLMPTDGLQRHHQQQRRHQLPQLRPRSPRRAPAHGGRGQPQRVVGATATGSTENGTESQTASSRPRTGQRIAAGPSQRRRRSISRLDSPQAKEGEERDVAPEEQEVGVVAVEPA